MNRRRMLMVAATELVNRRRMLRAGEQEKDVDGAVTELVNRRRMLMGQLQIC